MSVTIVITSCNRPKLLELTLKSFFKYNTFEDISGIIIIDDSGIFDCNKECNDLIPTKIKRNFMYNESNIGQIASIDKAYSYVETEYIFHCEEDWEFYDYGFIEKSLEILKNDEKIVCVWLRQYGDSSHPVLKPIINNIYRHMDRNYEYIYDKKVYNWMGFTFNPGLRRKMDYDIIKPFTVSCKPYFYSTIPDEIDVQKIYKNLEMYAAITLNKNGYVRHIGDDYHVKREYE